MTLRGACLLLGGIGLAVAGWFAGWPELTALGGAAVVAVLLVLLAVPSRRAVEVRVDAASLRVVRGEPASVKLALRAPGSRRALRVVEGDLVRPTRTVAVPRRGGRGLEVMLDVPVSTARRGLHPLGPFTVLRGDPWSIVRTRAGATPQGAVLVRPRVHPVRRGFAAADRTGDSETSSRRRGEDHFFALRDYVLGDEPRNVHWRSSARSGRLVVRQKVAAAVDGTLVVLDTDATAYGSEDAFSSGFLDERFEEAVEVAASLIAAKAELGQHVHLATTSRNQPRLSPGAGLAALVDALAVVDPAGPMDCNPAELPSIARRSRCSHLLVVTGTPGAELLRALRSGASLAPVVVRVGAQAAGPVPGVRTLDVADAAGVA